MTTVQTYPCKRTVALLPQKSAYTGSEGKERKLVTPKMQELVQDFKEGP